MRQHIRKMIAVCMMAVLFAGIITIPAKAADTASVSISSATATTGSTVSVTVKVTGSTSILMTDLYLSYDASVLEAVSGFDAGGGGMIRILSLEATSFTIQFKALKAGTSNVTVNTASSRVSTATTDSVALSAANGSVKVSAPVTHSSNNNLSSLQISPGTLSPAFSPNVTAYTATVGADCDKLTVSAITEDSTATTKITGTRMDPGSNTTTITVTAQNGSTKVYTIKTTKAEGATQKGTEKPTEQETDGQTLGANDAEVVVDGAKYLIKSDFTKYPLPSGYTSEDFEYNTYAIKVGKNQANKLTIMYLVKSDGTDEGAFYVYDTLNKSFCKMTIISQPDISYTILAIDNSMEIPEGFEKTKATINGNNVDVLIPKGITTSKYYLFYGTNSSGTAALYCYDTLEQTVQRYYGSGITEVPANASTTIENTREVRIWKMIAIIASAVAVIFMIVSIVLGVKKKSTYISNDFLDKDILEDDYIFEENHMFDEDEEIEFEEIEEAKEVSIDSLKNEIESQDDFEFLEIEDIEDENK